MKGQSVQSYTQEFKKRALTIGISLESPKTLLKYIGGLHSHLKHTIPMFNSTSLDDALVEATGLEARGKNVHPEVGGSSKYSISKRKEKKKLKWKEMKANTVNKDKPSCSHWKKEGNDEAHCWFFHPELKPKKFGGNEKKNVIAIQHDLGLESGNETTVTATGIKGKDSEASTSNYAQSIDNENNERERNEIFLY